MVEQITFYTSKSCPYAHRVGIALAEANAPHIPFIIDLDNKPAWYQLKVNPAGKIPAIAYGGPQVPPDQPSPDSIKIPESLVLLEFVADLYPNSALLPKDPVLRAKTRFFIDKVSNSLIPGWVTLCYEGKGSDALLKAFEEIQELLPEDKKYAVSDEFTNADAAIAPILARIDISLKNDLGVGAAGEGKKTYEVFLSDRFSKLQQYFEEIKARPSFKHTFDEDYVTTRYTIRFNALRAQKQAA